MAQFGSIFGFQKNDEDAHVALETFLEKLNLPYSEEATLQDKIELLGRSALVLSRTCGKLKQKNESLIASKEFSQEFTKNLSIKLSEKEELIQFYKMNTDFEEIIPEDTEERTKFEILRNLSFSSMLELHIPPQEILVKSDELESVTSQLDISVIKCARLEEDISKLHGNISELEKALSKSQTENLVIQSQSEEKIDPVLKSKLLQVFSHRDGEIIGENTLDFLWNKVFETIKDMRQEYEASLQHEKAVAKKLQALNSKQRLSKLYFSS